MLKVVVIMLCGIGVGYLLRRLRLRWLDATIMVLIWLLLFLLGVEVGENPRIIQGIANLGVEALVLGVAGIAGSAVLAWALWRWSRKAKNDPP